MVRTRIAPSPTGFPHIGTLYQALFNYAFAHKHDGKFIIRIEDTDKERFVEGAEDKIYSSIDWTNLIEDESPREGGEFGPYKSSERLDLYKKYAQELIDKGYAYYCFCTKERLDELRKKLQQEKKQLMYDKHCIALSKEAVEEKINLKTPYVIRMKVPQNEKIIVSDGLRGEIEFDSNILDDQVLLKSDGYPTYHLAAVVDDHLMKITHIIRGEEWISSAPKHVLLYRFFGWQMPKLYHTPLLRNPDKSKLSKRHGHTNVDWYKEEGFLPQAVLNFLALMGWSHPEEKEIFPLDEFIKLFDLKDIKSLGPIFDIKKLEWMNGVYIREVLSEDKLKEELLNFYKNDEEILNMLKNNSKINEIIFLAKTRMRTLKDFKLLLEDPNTSLNLNSQDKELGKKLIIHLDNLSVFKKDEILNSLKGFKDSNNTSMKQIYLLITGKESGLPLPEMMEIQGKETVLAKIQKNIS